MLHCLIDVKIHNEQYIINYTIVYIKSNMNYLVFGLLRHNDGIYTLFDPCFNLLIMLIAIKTNPHKFRYVRR